MTHTDDARQMLAELGPGKRQGTIYDTAWLARTIDYNRELGGQAMDWLSMNQLPDGSWGAASPLSYHDRVICTLAAMIALHRHGRRARDQRQIEHGLAALTRLVRGATRGLTADPSAATVGFEWIVPTLVAEAESHGILQNQAGRILGRMAGYRAMFIAALHPGSIWRGSHLAYAAELAGKDHLELVDGERLQEMNGSVACSPAATAYFALEIKPGDAGAIAYLQRAAPQSLAPHRIPFELQERVHVLWNLSRADLDESIVVLVRAHLAQLRALWQPGSGLGVSAECSAVEGELSCAGFELMARFGVAVDLGGVLSFEDLEYFRRYPVDPSTSVLTNAHALGALRQAGYDSQHPTVQKIFRYLERTRTADGFWNDSSHFSPYYATSKVVMVNAGWPAFDLVPSVQWIQQTCRANGSWGAYQPTAEETAYCLQALCVWKKSGGEVSGEMLRRGADWLKAHREVPHASLWIGKCLYSPDVIIRSAVLSALLMVEQAL
jgi:halimadienyl-diphosphate synthase